MEGGRRCERYENSLREKEKERREGKRRKRKNDGKEAAVFSPVGIRLLRKTRQAMNDEGKQRDVKKGGK